MIEAEIDVKANANGTLFVVGLVVSCVGYSAALIGCIAFFKIPLAWTFRLMLCGLIVATTIPKGLDRRLAFPTIGRAFFTTNFIGTLLIAGVMVLFANSNWKSWYVHPAGFQSTWLVVVSAFFHMDGIIRSSDARKLINEIHIYEYDENQATNPYAPPMRSKQSMDKQSDGHEAADQPL